MTDTPASSRRVLIAAAVAVTLASVTLVVAVLPAECGIDPLGTGRALGLTALAATEEDEQLAPSTLESVRVGVNTRQSGPLVQDTFTVELRPFEGVEFHGEPDGAPARFAESYGKGEGRAAQGVFIAPTAGVHGWFWENPGAGRVTITLKTSGFYSPSTEYRDGERHERMFGQ